MGTILAKEFGRTKDGRTVTAFELCNGSGMCVRILDYGGTIQSVIVLDRNGVPTDVALGYDDLASYEQGACYYGATVGRFANRIKDGRFMLDGREYRLGINSETESNHIHGVYPRMVFEASTEDGLLVLRHFSPSAEEGYPGDLTLEIRYSLGEDNALTLDYTATTDAPTVLNLTNHSCFNLNGQDGSTILDHKLRLNCSHYSEYEVGFAQTGNIIPVAGTPLDLRMEQTFGARFDDDYPPFRVCTGYDHNMVLDGADGELKLIGTVKSEKSGISLAAFTTEPAIQLYSGNFLHCDPVPHGKNGIRYPKNGGFCLEAQHYPDAMRHPHFPSTVLRPGETYRQTTIYRFTTE